MRWTDELAKTSQVTKGIDWSQFRLPKPELRARVKSRKRRRETAIKDYVRAKVADRDGHCRLVGAPFGPCAGESEWNHLERRSATLGMDPERRHRSDRSVMNCARHHGMVDQHEIGWEYLTERGADGPMRFWSAGVEWTDSQA